MASRTQLRLQQVTGSLVDLKSEAVQYVTPDAVAALTGSVGFNKHYSASLIEDTENLISFSGSLGENLKIGSSFKISNPQASSSCGCGTSFSI